MRMSRAVRSNVRAYLQCKLERSWKLLVEITEKQNHAFDDHIRTIKREAEAKISTGVRFMALKAWARDRRATLLE